LLDPAINLRLGAAHLRSLVDHFDGQTVVALAAYNAGRLAAQRWLPEEPLAADIWVENIPYNETREYVQRVLWHSVVFGWLGAGAAPPHETWLEPVTPRRTTTAPR
jgi:soluble lytic murein transglycosylase